jgi:asparagine synthase (glutamine-hydrolysing)
MSALAALWRFDDRPDAQSGCERMLAAQQMYGLHAVNQWSNGSVALGRRLMHLLPEDRFDRQPLVGGGGSIVVVADLRLDNRDELVRALNITERARVLSDGDILVAALEHWDEVCLDHIVGDFAFIRWDATRRQLLLARSPLGQRPLHYHWCNRFFAASSMPKGLHALPEVPCELDQDRIIKWLALQGDVRTKTFFSGVERVEPGHLVRVTASGVVARRFWLPQRRTIVLKGPQEYAEALRERLDEAVRCRLRGARNVAAHLSSGFDSSAVSATAARLLAPMGGKVVAFTAAPREGFAGPSPPNRIADESRLAAATAALYPNMEHVLIHSPDKSPLDDLDRCFPLFDQPMLTPCNLVWLNSINDAARERNLGVLLTGEMGNVTLSYDGIYLLPELFRRGRLLKWWRESRAVVARGSLRWRGIAALTFGPWIPGAIWSRIERAFKGKYPGVADYSAIRPERLAELEIAGRRRRRDGAAHDGFQRRLDIICGDDYGNWNKGILAGWQVDRRDPTVDTRLIEFCLAVPTDQYQRDGVWRALPRLALSDRLPRVVLDEPRRGVQAADWHERLTAVRDRVAGELDRIAACPAAAQVLDLQRLRTLVEKWPADGWERDDTTVIYRGGLLRALAMGHFLRNVACKFRSAT